MIGTKPDTVFAQTCTRRLVQILDHLGDIATEQNSEALGQTERQPARQTIQVFRTGQIVERRSEDVV